MVVGLSYPAVAAAKGSSALLEVLWPRDSLFLASLDLDFGNFGDGEGGGDKKLTGGVDDLGKTGQGLVNGPGNVSLDAAQGCSKRPPVLFASAPSPLMPL